MRRLVRHGRVVVDTGAHGTKRASVVVRGPRGVRANRSAAGRRSRRSAIVIVIVVVEIVRIVVSRVGRLAQRGHGRRHVVPFACVCMLEVYDEKEEEERRGAPKQSRAEQSDPGTRFKMASKVESCRPTTPKSPKRYRNAIAAVV